MLTAILVASIAVANPVESFVRENPAARLIRSADGSSLVHASGFLAETGAARPEEAARAFLRSHGAAFGIANDQALVRKGAPPVAGAAAIRFERTFQGLPVFGADLVVGVDAQNRIFLVNSGNVAPATWDRHLLGEAQAFGSAVSSFARGARGVEAVSVTAGWKAVAGALHAVYRVDFVARQPAGDWRVFVDAQTGRALFRAPLRSSVNGNVYPVSPAETADALCPLASGKPSICAPTVSIAFPNLSSGTDLGGSQTTVYNCKGADAPTSSAGIPGLCSSVAPLPANGGFGFSADSTFQLNSDDFSAAMAYFHLDKHLAFFKKLDPNLPSGASGRALTGSLPALVNVQEGGKAFENAFYSPLIDAMVFGQGAHADYAYDATVMYHESTHAVVSAWGGFDIGIDAQGGLDEPGAVNEGTADSMAVSETGRSEIGSFLSAVNPSPLPSGRELDDPGVLRSCQGSGTQVTILGGLNALNGLDGEVHDDGEIWNGFYWEVFRGLRAAGVKGCSGTCEAGPAIQYKALQLAAGTGPTLNGYWQTFKSAASALFPSDPRVAAYADCVARRRQMDRCDRTVTVYAGERKLQFVRLRYSPFQIVVPATGAWQFSVCSLNGTPTTAYARRGSPVQLSGIDPTTHDATVTRDASQTFTQACSAGVATFSLTIGGTWYLLFDSPNAFVGTNPGSEIYRVDIAPSGVSARPAATDPGLCATPSSLSIAPASPSVPPRGQATLTATGGSGAGYSWSLATNASGGSIVASSGAYTAGPTGSVKDTVAAADSAGNLSLREVTVTAGVSVSPATASAPARGSVTFAASGGSGTGFTWSLATNASGGSINTSTGAYTAGGTGGVIDTVQVTDSLGNTAAASVSVTAGGGGGGGCGTAGADDGLALALLALALVRRGRAKGAP